MSENKTNKIVVSESARKNVRMVIYQNTGEDGRKSSITRHEPLDSSAPVYRRKFGKANQ